MFALTQTCRFKLWVEAFHDDKGVDMLVSFELTHSPELARAAIALGHDEDTLRFRVEAVGAAFYDCAKQLLANPLFIAAREAAALAISPPAAPASGGKRL